MRAPALAVAPQDGRKGCGPRIAPLAECLRPLRQQGLAQIRAAGLIARVRLAREPGVSPASVTTISAELLDAGLIEKVAALFGCGCVTASDGHTLRGARDKGQSARTGRADPDDGPGLCRAPAPDPGDGSGAG